MVLKKKTMFKILYKVTRGDDGPIVTRYECQNGHIFEHCDIYDSDVRCQHCTRLEKLKQIEEKYSIRAITDSRFECKFCGLVVEERLWDKGFCFVCGCRNPS